MKNKITFLLVLSILFFSSCEKYISPNPDDFKNKDEVEKQLYVELYDDFQDEGQYWLPQQKPGKNYWIVVNASSNQNSYDDNSLRNHLLAESIIGLSALAVNEGRSETMVWTESPNSGYSSILDNINMVNNGSQSTWELLEHHDNVKNSIEGYVLCNVRKEESITVATMASHVYKAVIIDSYYEADIQALGYEKKYDASNKTLADGWAEFKDDCNNNSMILMPTLTANLRSYAIAHRLMAFNYNKEFNTTTEGNNAALYKEVLNWLEPLSPVLGWEQGVGEDAFVTPVSKSGNFLIPIDWAWNINMMSADYQIKQSGLAKVTNPKFIDFDTEKDYTSFFMSDGNNVQWMINAFLNKDYYYNENRGNLNMTFGIPLANLSMVSPIHSERIINEQYPTNTILHDGAAGYFYPDNFAQDRDNRAELLTKLAKRTASHMRQHRVKALSFICEDVNSPEAQEAYQTFISENDQLVGIVALQYHPYAGGDGEVMWFTNSQGYQIPVVTARYAIWNHGAVNLPNQGTPAFVASKINELSETTDNAFSLVVVHAWSRFNDIGISENLLAENIGGSEVGVTPLVWCKNRLNSNVEVVNTEELFWQLRMASYPEQTEDILATFY